MLTVAAAVSITSGKVQILSSLFVGNFADIHGGGFFMSQGTALIRSTLFVMVRKHFFLFCVVSHSSIEWSRFSWGGTCGNCWQRGNSI